MEKMIVLPESKLNKWFIMLNMSGNNTKLAVAREISATLEENTEQVAKGQIQAKIVNNEMIL